MTERQKNYIAKSYYHDYQNIENTLSDIAKAAEDHNIDLVLWFASKLKSAKAEFDGKFAMLSEFRHGVKVDSDGEAVLIDFSELSGDEKIETVAEFLDNKIVIERGESE